MHRPAACRGAGFPTAAARSPSPCTPSSPAVPQPLFYTGWGESSFPAGKPASGPASWHCMPCCPPQLHASLIKTISLGARKLFYATSDIGLTPGEPKSSFLGEILPIPHPAMLGTCPHPACKGVFSRCGSRSHLRGWVWRWVQAPAHCHKQGCPRRIGPVPIAGDAGGGGNGSEEQPGNGVGGQ